MAQNIINSDLFFKQIGEKLNDEMIKTSEPLVKKALEEIEKEMRKSLGAMLIKFIESEFSLERFGNDLVIKIRQ